MIYKIIIWCNNGIIKFEGGGWTPVILFTRGDMGLESGFRVTPMAGMEWAIEIELPIDSWFFEVPILCRGMRRLNRFSHFLMFFKKKTKRRIAICISILVGLQRSIFGLPSYTLSQKMRFRVGRPQLFSWKSEDVPRENTSFETKCRKVVQILTSGDRPRSIYKWRFSFFEVFFPKQRLRWRVLYIAS